MSNPKQRLLNVQEEVDGEAPYYGGPSESIWGTFLDVMGKFFGCCCCVITCGCCCYPYRSVSRGNRGIITRFGSAKTVVNDGLHYVNPITEKMVTVDIMTHVKKLSNQAILTRDNLPLTIDGAVFYRINNTVGDVLAAKFKIYNIGLAVEELAHSTLRMVFGKHTLEECLEKRQEFAAEMRNILGDQARAWGVVIEDIQIIEIVLPKHIQELLATGATAKSEAEAKLISAKTDVKAAELLRAAADQLNTPAAMQMRMLETYKVLAESQNSKIIFLPTTSNFDNLTANILANEVKK